MLTRQANDDIHFCNEKVVPVVAKSKKKQVRDKAACRILQSSTALAAPLVTQSENFQLKGRLTDTVFVHKLS